MDRRAYSRARSDAGMNALDLSPLEDALLESLPGLAMQLSAGLATIAARLANGNGTNTQAEDKLLTPKEAAPLLAVSPDWIYKRADSGELPFIVKLPMATTTTSKN